jgi:hypothetical protein
MRTLHVKFAAAPSGRPPRGCPPIGAVRLSTWPDPDGVDWAFGSPGGRPFKMASALEARLNRE